MLVLHSASYLARRGLMIAAVCRIENKCKYSLMTVILADLMTVWKLGLSVDTSHRNGADVLKSTECRVTRMLSDWLSCPQQKETKSVQLSHN